MTQLPVTPLKANQLCVAHKLAHFSDLPNKAEILNLKSRFLPRLSELLSLVKCPTINTLNIPQKSVFLLSSTSNPILFLSWLLNKTLIQTNLDQESLIGTFKQSARLSRFVEGELFNSDNDFIMLSASAILQDEKLFRLIGRIIQSKKVDSRWLIPTSHDKQNFKYVHKTRALDKNIIFYGDREALYQIHQLMPILKEAAYDRVLDSDYAAPINAENSIYMHDFLKTQISSSLTIEQTHHIIWGLSRQLEDQSWMSLNLNLINQLFEFTPTRFTQSDIESAIKKINGFDSLDRVLNYEQIIQGTVKVDFTGEVVGQINGLSVVETESAEFGEPSRITANIFSGEGDIGDIERKSDLGGNIHAKAMMILSSFVSRVFAQNEPLPISSNIVFEQSYHGVDGDSASLAELYALLSAISDVPIKQNIAVTGAIDQFGNVLAVGGVDLKIEGFYTLAKQLAPNEIHHIIIPKANELHLNLSQPIKQAVKDKKVFIYPIEHVVQASKILTGLDAETESQDGLYDKVKDTLLGFDDDKRERLGLVTKIWLIFKHLFTKAA